MASQNKVSAVVRNEYLGHWFDAKTSVSQNFADLKTVLQLRKQMAEVQFQLQESGAPVTHTGQYLSGKGLHRVGQNPRQVQRQLEAMISEFQRYQTMAEQQTDKLKTIIMALKVKDSVYREETNKAKVYLEELTRSIEIQQSINKCRRSVQKKHMQQRSVSPISLNGSRRDTSPFEKRLVTNQ